MDASANFGVVSMHNFIHIFTLPVAPRTVAREQKWLYQNVMAPDPDKGIMLKGLGIMGALGAKALQLIATVCAPRDKLLHMARMLCMIP